jgi:hypothetical protein
MRWLGKICRIGNFFPAELAASRLRRMRRSPRFIEHFKQMSVDLPDNSTSKLQAMVASALRGGREAAFHHL